MDTDQSRWMEGTGGPGGGKAGHWRARWWEGRAKGQQGGCGVRPGAMGAGGQIQSDSVASQIRCSGYNWLPPNPHFYLRGSCLPIYTQYVSLEAHPFYVMAFPISVMAMPFDGQAY